MFFSLKKDSRTRGHEVTLVKDQCRLDIRKYSLSQTTINEWNKLSTDCVTAIDKIFLFVVPRRLALTCDVGGTIQEVIGSYVLLLGDGN